MALTDLPGGWSDDPITDPARLCAVLDLVVDRESRVRGELYMLFCDVTGRLLVPVCLGGDEALPGGDERRRALTSLVDILAAVDPDGGVVAAIARPGGLSVTSEDYDWADAVAAAAAGRIRLLGVHVVTMDGSRPVPARSPRSRLT